jgi:hypothetical protein
MKQPETNLIDFQEIFIKININILNYIYSYYNIENNINLNNTEFNKIFSHFFIDGVIKFYKDNPDRIILISKLNKDYAIYYKNKPFLTCIRKLIKILTNHLCIPLIIINKQIPKNRNSGEYKEFIANIQQQYNSIHNRQLNYKKFKQFLSKNELFELKSFFDNPKNLLFTK